MLSLLLGWPAVASAQGAPGNRHFPVQVRIAPGVIVGMYDVETGIQRYLGIPFAQPPVGPLRWKAPQPVIPWSGVRAATHFGASPVQAVPYQDIVFRSDGMSEDCLYLNVWTPARHDTTGLPVLLYFFGGGFVAGSGSEARYDGASMAAKGIVVVTTNYRLGIFGSFAHPGLSTEAPYHASGNYGFLDQNAALRWVHDNIAAFGGDPRHITIAGESAGSLSVSLHMASPLSRDLIAGAIGESGSMLGSSLAAVPLAEAEKQGADFAQKAGNLSLEQLRAMSTREIFEIYQASKRWGFPAVVDGYLLPKPAVEIFRAGEEARVPLLVGWNSAEIPGDGVRLQADDVYEGTLSGQARGGLPEGLRNGVCSSTRRARRTRSSARPPTWPRTVSLPTARGSGSTCTASMAASRPTAISMRGFRRRSRRRPLTAARRPCRRTR